MLLSVETFDDSSHGALLSVWQVGGSHRTVKPPSLPHYYSALQYGDSELVVKRLLSNPAKKRGVYRVEFPTDYARRKFAWLTHSDDTATFEAKKRFEDQLVSEFGFACPSAMPTVLSWDVETYTFSRVNPDPLRDTIRSISVWGVVKPQWLAVVEPQEAVVCSYDPFVSLLRIAGDYNAELQFDGETGEFGFCWKVCPDMGEAECIEAFLKFARWFDPDVLCGFNDGGYDIKVLKVRCGALAIGCELGRNGGTPEVTSREVNRRGKPRVVDFVRVRGRVHLDVYNEVLFDQTLYDLKGLGQLEVAKHFDLCPIEGVDHGDLTDENVAEVNLDDARCCFGLAEIYLRNIYSLCEELAVPLNMMVDRNAGTVCDWFYGQEFHKAGIISDGINRDRFPRVFARGGKPFQGATVKCVRRGLFKPVVKIDFSSFYPSLMDEYNLSPETVSLISMSPYTGEYKFEKCDGYMIIEVPDVPMLKGKPDMEHAVQFRCRVETSFDGVTRIKIREFRKKREKLKAEASALKEAGKPYEHLESQQYALKVIQNTIYGYSGAPFSIYGNVLMAILITALGRYHIELKIKEIEAQGYLVIEVDTDGILAQPPKGIIVHAG